MQQTWPFPARDLVLENDHVRITPVELEHDLQNLFVAASIEHNRDDIFTYHVNVPPMKDLETFRRYLTKKLATHSEVTYKVFSKRLQCLAGCASLMSVRTEHGTIEVGSIWYSKAAQRTEINSNAIFRARCS